MDMTTTDLVNVMTLGFCCVLAFMGYTAGRHR